MNTGAEDRWQLTALGVVTRAHSPLPWRIQLADRQEGRDFDSVVDAEGETVMEIENETLHNAQLIVLAVNAHGPVGLAEVQTTGDAHYPPMSVVEVGGDERNGAA